MNKQKWQEYIKKTEQLMTVENNKLVKLGSLRVISFLLAIISLTLSAYQASAIGYLISITLFIIFFYLVKRYKQIEDKKAYFLEKEKVLGKYLARLDDTKSGWKSFEENGASFLEEHDSKSRDLDILGRSSLYQFICTANTLLGKKTLAHALTKGFQDSKIIEKRQEAIKELIKQETLNLHLQTLSSQIKASSKESEEGIEQFLQQAEENSSDMNKGMRLLSYGIPFITLFAIVSAAFGIAVLPSYIIACGGILVQLIIWGLYSGKSEAVLGPVYYFAKRITIYSKLLSAIEEAEFKSEYLKELQNKLLKDGSSTQGIKALNQLSGFIDLRYNIILNILLNGLLMWDVHCKDGLYQWQCLHGKHMRTWLEVIGEIEALISLSVPAQLDRTYCYPIIYKQPKPYVDFKDLAHPLIDGKKAVSNSFSLEQGTCIITGSNMSGKTTFLRSIGVNLVLAYAGSVVFASDFKASKMKLFTSMRIEDRVDEGISTFYAELLRIKEMVNYSQKNEPMLVLIDEIFKGTNSADRILGASETIKKLGKPWVNVMVSTHDFELCELKEVGRKIVNYHFEEYYEADKIRFDYRLKQGRCQTTNAKYLLKMIGILDEKRENSSK